MLLRYAYYKPFTVSVNDRTGSPQTTKGAWYGVPMGPRHWGSRRGHSFSLGLHTMVFEAEMYAIKAYIMENIEKGFK